MFLLDVFQLTTVYCESRMISDLKVVSLLLYLLLLIVIRYCFIVQGSGR